MLVTLDVLMYIIISCQTQIHFTSPSGKKKNFRYKTNQCHFKVDTLSLVNSFYNLKKASVSLSSYDIKCIPLTKLIMYLASVS